MAGPRVQLRPTTSAPASCSARHVSAAERPSRIVPSRCMASVITAGIPACLMTSVASSASASQEKVSPTMKSTPACTAHCTCSSNIARTWSREPPSAAYRFVLQTSPASSVPVSAATSAAIRSAWRLIGSSRCSWPIRRSFSRWA